MPAKYSPHLYQPFRLRLDRPLVGNRLAALHWLKVRRQITRASNSLPSNFRLAHIYGGRPWHPALAQYSREVARFLWQPTPRHSGRELNYYLCSGRPVPSIRVIFPTIARPP